jgi:hypothetical protein
MVILNKFFSYLSFDEVKKKYTWPTLVIDLNATIDLKTFLSIYINLAIHENATFQVPT